MNPLRITYRRAGGALALLTIVAALLGPAAGHAEEKGMTITLSYVRGYSNWGPTNVYGNAQFWPSEGVAALYTHNLPRLLHGDTYASWVVNTTSGDVRRLGTFNTDDAGDGYEDITFDGGLPPGSNALLVTVQHPGDPATGPGPQRTLAGFFPTGQGHNATPSQPANPGTVATPPTPTAPPQNANHPAQPSQPGHTGSAGSSGSKESTGIAGAGGNSARAHGVKALPTTGRPCPACLSQYRSPLPPAIYLPTTDSPFPPTAHALFPPIARSAYTPVPGVAFPLAADAAFPLAAYTHRLRYDTGLMSVREEAPRRLLTHIIS